MNSGQKLGCGAHLASLRRTAVAEFTIEQSHTLEQIAEAAARVAYRGAADPSPARIAGDPLRYGHRRGRRQDSQRPHRQPAGNVALALGQGLRGTNRPGLPRQPRSRHALPSQSCIALSSRSPGHRATTILKGVILSAGVPLFAPRSRRTPMARPLTPFGCWRIDRPQILAHAQ